MPSCGLDVGVAASEADPRGLAVLVAHRPPGSEPSVGRSAVVEACALDSDVVLVDVVKTDILELEVVVPGTVEKGVNPNKSITCDYVAHACDHIVSDFDESAMSCAAASSTTEQDGTANLLSTSAVLTTNLNSSTLLLQVVRSFI